VTTISIYMRLNLLANGRFITLLPMQILRKPIATYTQMASERCVKGKVILKITFLSNGTVGNIKVIKGLPAGLSQQAILAARLIKFIPARKNGLEITTRRRLEYNFSIY